MCMRRHYNAVSASCKRISLAVHVSLCRRLLMVLCTDTRVGAHARAHVNLNSSFLVVLCVVMHRCTHAEACNFAVLHADSRRCARTNPYVNLQRCLHRATAACCMHVHPAKICRGALLRTLSLPYICPQVIPSSMDQETMQRQVCGVKERGGVSRYAQACPVMQGQHTTLVSFCNFVDLHAAQGRRQVQSGCHLPERCGGGGSGLAACLLTIHGIEPLKWY